MFLDIEDIERRLALVELLAQPDPPELRRGYRLRLAGSPDRYALVPRLTAAFVQAKLLALHERSGERTPEIASPADAVAHPRPVLRPIAA